jgi:hypothetical protein
MFTGLGSAFSWSACNRTLPVSLSQKRSYFLGSANTRAEIA